MINTKTTTNIYTIDSECEMQIANLYVMARRERLSICDYMVHLLMC